MSARLNLAAACSLSSPVISAVTAVASKVAVAGALYLSSVNMLYMRPISLWRYWIIASRMFEMMWPGSMSMIGSSGRYIFL